MQEVLVRIQLVNEKNPARDKTFGHRISRRPRFLLSRRMTPPLFAGKYGVGFNRVVNETRLAVPRECGAHHFLSSFRSSA